MTGLQVAKIPSTFTATDGVTVTDTKRMGTVIMEDEALADTCHHPLGRWPKVSRRCQTLPVSGTHAKGPTI